ncbi:TMhelix containing protein [Vibrio phage 1.081.O._10N.286.52.C2]|nr:TMhelix containing protein [Vibrio phage 1.081.O._10N.286.52.C2]
MEHITGSLIIITLIVLALAFNHVKTYMSKFVYELTMALLVGCQLGLTIRVLMS